MRYQHSQKKELRRTRRLRNCEDTCGVVAAPSVPLHDVGHLAADVHLSSDHVLPKTDAVAGRQLGAVDDPLELAHLGIRVCFDRDDVTREDLGTPRRTVGDHGIRGRVFK